MERDFRNKWIAVLLVLAVLALGLAGCGTKETGEARTKTCFIYTDGLLDDLCAIEYLAGRYDSAVILLQDPDGLAGNDYGSAAVTDKDALLRAASGWFASVTEYADGVDLSGADLYLLGPLTEFAELLRNEPSLKDAHALLMAGTSEGPDGAGEEWNAAADEAAYRYVTETMTDLTQMTAPACEAAFAEGGYPFQAQFLEEYISQMEAMDENVCCYDLQAVAAACK